MTAVIIDGGPTVTDHQTVGGMHSREYTEQRLQLSGEGWCADKHAPHGFMKRGVLFSVDVERCCE